MCEMIGKVVGGRFLIERLIGKGGMGAVYEARHEVLPRKFAIKILRPDLSRDTIFIERFRREAIASSRVDHPNVIHITDFGAMDDGAYYLVMEYLEGTGLDQLLSRYTRISIHRALPILIQVADALDSAHRVNVIHRDLKPENILLCEVRGQQDFVKLLDFGIAKMQTPEFANNALTLKGQVFGTAEYMSPEQAIGGKLDGRADIYAVGCLAYELLTGNPPFTGEPIHILRAHVKETPAPPSSALREHHIPPPLDALVLRCLAKEPADRYQTGAELRQAILRMRALLFSMSDEDIASQQRTPETGPRQKLTEGWHSLDGAIPSIPLPSTLDQVMEAAPATVTAPQQPASSPEKLREEYHDVLKELAIALVQAALASADASESLSRLLILEEQITSLAGTIALAEQNFDRIRFDFSQREKKLRHAILDLSMSRAKVQGQAAVTGMIPADLQGHLDDLSFQITALSGRCDELAQERDAEIGVLANEVQEYRRSREEMEQECAEIYQALHAQVEALRPGATDPALAGIYGRLDELVSSLEHARP